MDIELNVIAKARIDVLNKVLERTYELGGMGEYGNGWNDRGVQIKMVVEEIKREIVNESKEGK